MLTRRAIIGGGLALATTYGLPHPLRAAVEPTIGIAEAIGAFLAAHVAKHAAVEAELSAIFLDVLAKEEQGVRSADGKGWDIPAGRGGVFKAVLGALQIVNNTGAGRIKKGEQATDMLVEVSGKTDSAGNVIHAGLIQTKNAEVVRAEGVFDIAVAHVVPDFRPGLLALKKLQTMPTFSPDTVATVGGPLGPLITAFRIEHVARHEQIYTKPAIVATSNAIGQIPAQRQASKDLLVGVLYQLKPTTPLVNIKHAQAVENLWQAWVPMSPELRLATKGLLVAELKPRLQQWEGSAEVRR
jgi:hypothetical protein